MGYKYRSGEPTPVFLNAEQGNCFGVDDPSIFYEKSRFWEALEYCNDCPIAEYCKDWAVENKVVGTAGGHWIPRPMGGPLGWHAKPPEWVAKNPG